MKNIILVVLLAMTPISHANNEVPVGYCEVEICNKLKRISLDLWSHLKDEMGKVCMPGVVPKDKAVQGLEIDSKSKWYQGTFNPTKRSVTYVIKVYTCNDRTSSVTIGE